MFSLSFRIQDDELFHLLKNSHISHLMIDENQLKSIQKISILRQLPNLQQLQIAGNRIGESDFYRQQLFQKIPHLKIIDCHDKYGNIAIQSQSEEQSQNCSMKKLKSQHQQEMLKSLQNLQKSQKSSQQLSNKQQDSEQQQSQQLDQEERKIIYRQEYPSRQKQKSQISQEQMGQQQINQRVQHLKDRKQASKRVKPNQDIRRISTFSKNRNFSDIQKNADAKQPQKTVLIDSEQMQSQDREAKIEAVQDYLNKCFTYKTQNNEYKQSTN